MALTRLNILLIEGDAADAGMVTGLLLESDRYRFTVEHKDVLAGGLESISAGHFDAVLINPDLPDSDTAETLDKIEASSNMVPFLVIADDDEHLKAIDAIRHQAQEVLPRNRLSTSLLEYSLLAAMERFSMMASLKQSAQWWNNVFEHSSDLISVHDPHYRFLKVNRALARYLDAEPEELIGRLCYKVFQCAGEPPGNCPHTRTLEAGVSHTADITITGGHTILATTCPVFNGNRRVTSTIHMARDITSRVTADRELTRHIAILDGMSTIFRLALTAVGEEKLASTCLEVPQSLTGSNFGILGELNEQGRLDTIALTDTGWDACRMGERGQTMLMLTNMELRGLWKCVITTGRPVIINNPAEDPDSVGVPEGHPRIDCFLGVPLIRDDTTVGLVALANKESGYDEEDRETVEHLVPAIMEALARKRVELRMRHSEERYRLLTEMAPDGIISFDDDGRIYYTNSSAEKLFGYGPGELNGKSCLDLMPPEEGQTQGNEFLNVLVRGREEHHEILSQEMTGLRKDGSRFPVDLSVSYWRHGDGFSATCIMRDLSQRKNLEERLRAEKNKAESASNDLSMLYTVADTINREFDLKSLLDQVLATITSMDLLDIESKGGVFIREGEHLKLVSHIGSTDAFIDLHQIIKVGDCLCGLAAQTGETILSRNCHDDPRHTISYAGMPPHGHLIIPLKSGATVVGVLYLYIPADVRLEERQIDLMETISDQLAVAIERVRLFEETKALSLHDPLTGLANRNLMNLELKKAFAWARRTGSSFSLILMDLDHFKNYNDSFGHSAGDQLLKDIASLILEEIREVDLAVRFGGEEFLVILPDTGKQEAAEVAERIRRKIAGTSFFYSDGEPPARITVSLGIATSSSDARDTDELIRRSDNALYRAKDRGRNRVEVWTDS